MKIINKVKDNLNTILNMSFYKFENNRKIGTIFRRVSKELAMTGNKFKGRAFDRALQSMEYNQKTEITLETVKSLIELKNVGRSAIGLIEKILNGEEVDILKPEQRQRVSSLEILTTLYGVGLSAANKWYDAGIHNLDELREAYSTKTIKQGEKENPKDLNSPLDGYY